MEDYRVKIRDFEQVANTELKGSTLEERVEWIAKIKENGDGLYSIEKFGSAIEAYMQALCGYDFKPYTIDSAQKTELDLKVKVPLLSNMSACLMHLKTEAHCQMALNVVD